jgi:acetylglutamate/LysW-gamma-L-alpha-aminoadipate kinase
MLIVKIGGGKNINWDFIISDLVSLSRKEKIILVHGANYKRDEIAKKLGVETKYITSPSGHKGVYTDAKAIEIMTMIYSGLVNKTIVSKLQTAGINAVGLSGADGRIWEGKRKTNILSIENGKTKLVKDTFTGKVEKVNIKLLNLLLDNGYMPVLTQPAISYKGELINTDNDRNIAVMAAALNSDIVNLFEAPGLLKDYLDEGTLVKKIDRKNIDDAMDMVDGRMKKKVLGAKEALEMGVKKIYWGDARIAGPISSALSGKGTVIS